MPSRRFKLLGGLLLCSVGLNWQAMDLLAQTETAIQDQDEQVESAPVDSTSKKRDQESQSEPETITVDIESKPDRFVPSEEISEDLSVPFPTDI
jgi:hypothetical protein